MKKWLTVAALLLGPLPVALVLASPKLLVIEERPVSADAIVVLGGDEGNRVLRAAELFHDRIAPRVVVSGGGDCYGMRSRLLLNGVPAAAIQSECRSRTTAENAEFAASILRNDGARRIVLVTSWYHTRRAVACFRHFAPGVAIVSVPAWQGTKSRKPSVHETVVVLAEYVKTAWYAVRYRVCP